MPQMIPVAQLMREVPDLRGRVLLLDFDETLWLDNSTEAFLASARPRLATRIVLAGVRRTAPVWRLADPVAQAHRRDWLRVRAVSLAMPWTLRRWAAEAPALARHRRNAALVALVRRARPDRVIVVTNGFAPIVGPMIGDIGLPVDMLISAPLRGGEKWRRRGKVAQVQDCLSADDLDRACFITDHPQDADLLRRVETGLLCRWTAGPGADDGPSGAA